ncbi:Uncharacterized protein dnm_081200 [Desulfonema magnum]|uniref:Uncharacterized protein n=1 Tax=Desulfonema magnum TaxID=45655 RepID=A0A975BUK8_9BACT|nr:Uncharacterized protein dnm_081200 [Desulfonema magnum]
MVRIVYRDSMIIIENCNRIGKVDAVFLKLFLRHLPEMAV